jgi:hypothetical protein
MTKDQGNEAVDKLIFWVALLGVILVVSLEYFDIVVAYPW